MDCFAYTYTLLLRTVKDRKKIVLIEVGAIYVPNFYTKLKENALITVKKRMLGCFESLVN